MKIGTTLRDYQIEMKRRLYEAWKEHRSVMLQMPTGTGKTHLMASVIADAFEGGVLIVAHRIELVEQISRTLDAFGIVYGKITGRSVSKEGLRIQVASIQTLNKRMAELPLNPSLIIIDEAHHALAKTYRRLWNQWPHAHFLGMTATPCRLNNKGFTDLFEILLESYDIDTFITRGILSDFEYVSVRPESRAMLLVAALKKRSPDGDFQTAEMATVMDCPESIAHLYASYRYFASGKKGIVYAIDCEHARHISEYYELQGVRTCVIDAKTPWAERQELLTGYRNGMLDVMINVDIFSEGFDCPEVEFIQLARPTLSLSKYLQQVGRGMRVSKGKDHVLILDQVGLYQTFGLPTEKRNWQSLFKGQTAGKGALDCDRTIVLRDEPDNKMLVNLEMVRIKNRHTVHKGVEIFMQGGKYGVMQDGRVTCRAVYARMERLAAPYFSMAVYPYRVFNGKKTIIDGDGKDLQADLYGRIERFGDFFKGMNIAGQIVYWDAKGRRSYPVLPEVVQAGRIEMVRIGDRYRLRQQIPDMNFECAKEDIYIGKQLTIIKDMLIVKKDFRNPYKVYGYLKDGILVGNTVNGFKGSYMLMKEDGRLSVDYFQLPWNAMHNPRQGHMQFKQLD
mgnify:CR=1 FL=1